MNIFYSIGMGGALALASALATAQSVPDSSLQQSPSVSIKANELRIELPDYYRKMSLSEYRDYVREYSLSNGVTMRIFPSGPNMYATLDDGAWHKIVATPSNTFVALDRQLKMRIKLDNDEASGEVVMVVPARRLDDGSLAQATLQRSVLR